MSVHNGRDGPIPWSAGDVKRENEGTLYKGGGGEEGGVVKCSSALINLTRF